MIYWLVLAFCAGQFVAGVALEFFDCTLDSEGLVVGGFALLEALIATAIAGWLL